MKKTKSCPACKPSRPCAHHRILEIQRELRETLSAKRCPACKCSGKVCRIVLSDGESEGVCVPAGKLGLENCSACLPRAA